MVKLTGPETTVFHVHVQVLVDKVMLLLQDGIVGCTLVQEQESHGEYV